VPTVRLVSLLLSFPHHPTRPPQGCRAVHVLLVDDVPRAARSAVLGGAPVIAPTFHSLHIVSISDTAASSHLCYSTSHIAAKLGLAGGSGHLLRAQAPTLGPDPGARVALLAALRSAARTSGRVG